MSHRLYSWWCIYQFPFLPAFPRKCFFFRDSFFKKHCLEPRISKMTTAIHHRSIPRLCAGKRGRRRSYDLRTLTAAISAIQDLWDPQILRKSRSQVRGNGIWGTQFSKIFSAGCQGETPWTPWALRRSTTLFLGTFSMRFLVSIFPIITNITSRARLYCQKFLHINNTFPTLRFFSLSPHYFKVIPIFGILTSNQTLSAVLC